MSQPPSFVLLSLSLSHTHTHPSLQPSPFTLLLLLLFVLPLLRVQNPKRDVECGLLLSPGRGYSRSSRRSRGVWKLSGLACQFRSSAPHATK